MKEFYEEQIKTAEKILELAKLGFNAYNTEKVFQTDTVEITTLNTTVKVLSYDCYSLKEYILAIEKLEREIESLKEASKEYDKENVLQWRNARIFC